MKRIIIVMAVAAMVCSCWVKPTGKNDGGSANTELAQAEGEYDVTIVGDDVIDGVRVIKVEPCETVCSTAITISLKDGMIQSVVFENGCPGNTLGVAALAKGLTVEEAISRLDGIPCATRPTSCPDQLARALKLSLQSID